MKLGNLFLASFLACVPLQAIQAQNSTSEGPGYSYIVTSTDSVNVAYDQFATITVDCNQDFKVSSNNEWIRAQKVSKNSVIVFFKENTTTETRKGSITLTTLDGKGLKTITINQSNKDANNIIPENKTVQAPMMGWTSQGTDRVKEEYLLQQANAMKQLGLQAAGYKYVLLDNTTFEKRNTEGQLVASAAQFPKGIENTVDQLHGQALKVGIQTHAGKDLNENYGKGLGLMGNEQNDCNYWFNQLGFNFIQVDFADINKEGVQKISDCISATGKNKVNLNVNAGAYPGTWITPMANAWRTVAKGTIDWKTLKAAVYQNRFLSAYAGNGKYNDMDVLQLNHRLNVEEEKTYFGLWCMLNSPLVINGDLTKINPRTLALMKNKELISLNQNATLQQAYITQYINGCYVWVKDINKDNKNCRAVAVFNTSDEAQEVMVSMSKLDLAGKVNVHDAFTNKDVTNVTEQLSVAVPAHGTRIYLLEADGRMERQIYEAETGYIPAFSGLKDEGNKAIATYEEDANCSGNAKVCGLGHHKENALEWNNVESNEGGLYQITIDYLCEGTREMTIEINQTPVKTAKLNGEDGRKVMTLTINADLLKGKNSIRLSNATGAMPAIDVMNIRPCQSAELFVEAENFNVKGGWKVDQQFMDIMGSPYINAHGMGVPVEDATTEIEIPQNNTYHVYARTYNWTSPWTDKEGPGQFQLEVDGKRMTTVLGSKGNKWEWQYAGSVTLEQGKHTLTIHDMTGFNGRVDAIYFNSEKVAPPSDVKELGKFRRTQLNIPNTPEIQKEFDLVVCGAGIAGMCTAMAAARQGMNVALINDRPIIGGNNSAEVRVHLGGRIEVPPYTNLGNLIKEFGHTKVGNAMPAANYEDERKMEWIRSEKNITLFLNNRVNQVHMNDDQIDYVISQNTETGVRTLYKAPLFVDCTGDGTIGALAGADFRMGRESKHEFNESKGPEEADKMTMGNSNQWYAVSTTSPSSFPLFEYGVVFNESNREAMTKGDWNWENGMHQNQIEEFERIRDYGLMVVYSNWSFLKNKYSDKALFANKKLEWVAFIGGKRESRRLMGDYILNGNDIVNHNVQPDFTAGTSWSIDLHYPIAQNETDFNGEAFKSWADHLKVYSYPVPYRCLYSRNVNNLFMAGRNISVSHMALGTTRVMRTTGMIGEVVGLAASVCKKYNALPRDVYKSYFNDLVVLMKKGAGKQGLPNNQKFNNGSWLNN